MSVDYDLVILGGTAAARDAAFAASALKARVALIEPGLQDERWLGTEVLSNHALTQIARTVQQMRRVRQFGLSWTADSKSSPSVNWSEMVEWVKAAVDVAVEEGRSPTVLASLGVEVILGKGEFCRRPYRAVAVNGRLLRARAYLIATGSRPIVPPIDGLAAANPLTPASIWQPTPLSSPPHNLIVIGDEPVGVELAQTFARLGSQVTLVISTAHLLPHEDFEAARLIQAQLEAEGVHVLCQTQVTQVKRLDRKKWVQAGTQALEADEILLAVGRQPQIESLNLEAVGVESNSQGIQINAKLQTTHPQIYACGEVTKSSYPFAHIGSHEARVALNNALFFPVFQVNYRTLPWTIFTDPALARIGLTETQARQRYKNDVVVLRQPFKTVAKAQMRGETTGFCKIIARHNGEILGAHLVGPEAEELMGAIALAIQEKRGIKSLTKLSAVSPTLSEIVQHTALGWERERRDRNPFLQNLLEGWFRVRRS